MRSLRSLGRDALFLGVVVLAISVTVWVLLPTLRSPRVHAEENALIAPVRLADETIVEAIDAAIRAGSADLGLAVAPRADDLTICRRVSLALTGRIPSLEEIRAIEAHPESERVDAWIETLLNERRYADFVAERFARAFVGTEGGPFIIYRRRRFVSWLSDQLLEGRPYDAIVRDLIASEGLWTDKPANNFVTVAFDNEQERIDPDRLAARVARAFLGVRIDCAQCHDHPFQDWTQRDFQGLAAFFGQTRNGFTGIHEDPQASYRAVDLETGDEEPIDPRVPFLETLLPEGNTRRERLAGWLISPGNPALARVTVNRVWAILFGRPLVDPVDDLEAVDEIPAPLELLADDFVTHGYDLKRLIRIITATEAFRRASAMEPEPTWDHEAAWAVFPLVRLRSEQVAGALLQASALETLDEDSHILAQILTVTRTGQFVDRFGDPGADEFVETCTTIPQRLLMMNGEIVREAIEPGLFTAATRIAQQAPDDRTAVEIAYLTVLTRRPTTEEAEHFADALNGTRGEDRSQVLSDLVWTLLNATEFSWNH